jgi:uncharacterized SAM-binding protein YcdF (DUF218 family)
MSGAPARATMSRVRRRGRWVRVFATVMLLPVLLWLGGLLWFASSIPNADDDGGDATDAIVVLTGGSQRLQSGLQLLSEGRGKKLFVSGVYRGTDVSALLHSARQESDALQCCVVLGHDAENTAGNAVETSQWMSRENYRSLRLVTANYHMRRALLEFSRAMPGIRIVPHPVFPPVLEHEHWWGSPGALEIVVGEYDKYLVALARPLLPFELAREEPPA